MLRFGVRFVDADVDVSAWLYPLVGAIGGMTAATYVPAEADRSEGSDLASSGPIEVRRGDPFE